MGKSIQVFAWCDPHGEKAGVGATHLNVPLRWGKTEVTIDLCAAHYKEIGESLTAFLLAGTKAGKVNSQGGARRGRRPKEYYDQLRAWLKARGIEAVTGADGKTVWPEKERAEFDAELAGQESA